MPAVEGAMTGAVDGGAAVVGGAGVIVASRGAERRPEQRPTGRSAVGSGESLPSRTATMRRRREPRKHHFDTLH